jgi:hypothetical protein
VDIVCGVAAQENWTNVNGPPSFVDPDSDGIDLTAPGPPRKADSGDTLVLVLEGLGSDEAEADPAIVKARFVVVSVIGTGGVVDIPQIPAPARRACR